MSKGLKKAISSHTKTIEYLGFKGLDDFLIKQQIMSKTEKVKGGYKLGYDSNIFYDNFYYQGNNCYFTTTLLYRCFGLKLKDTFESTNKLGDKHLYKIVKIYEEGHSIDLKEGNNTITVEPLWFNERIINPINNN